MVNQNLYKFLIVKIFTNWNYQLMNWQILLFCSYNKIIKSIYCAKCSWQLEWNFAIVSNRFGSRLISFQISSMWKSLILKTGISLKNLLKIRDFSCIKLIWNDQHLFELQSLNKSKHVYKHIVYSRRRFINQVVILNCTCTQTILETV